MKALKSLPAIFAILCICFISCQKEIDYRVETQPVPVIPVVPDSTYLDKLIFTTVKGTLSDTTQIIFYDYDALNRVTTVRDVSLKGSSHVTDRLSYFYDHGDTIPYQSQEVFYEPSGDNALNDTISSYFTFSPNGKRLLDSILINNHFVLSGLTYTSNEKGIMRYEFPGSNFYASETYSQLGGDFPGITLGLVGVQRDTGVLDMSGNLLANKRYAISFLGFYNASSFTYDNHPNPFSRLSNAKAIDLIPYGYAPIHLLKATNNRLHARDLAYNGSVDYDEDLTGKYHYLSNGYPKEIVQPRTSDTLKRTFIYRSF